MKTKLLLDAKIEIPEKVSIFPLPNVILFPGIDLPLYIFEPRYRKMLKDCSEGSKFIAISMMRRGWEDKKEPVPSHDIVGVGYVRAIFENPDGTSHILLKGICRAQVTRYTQFEPYRIAKVREIPDEAEEDEEIHKLATHLRRLLSQKLRYGSENPQEQVMLPREFENPVTLSHIACFLSEVNSYRKQGLFETTSCAARLRDLIEVFQAELHPLGSKN